ncbi:MAG: GGDEF domain-containing protein [Rhodobacteraceae bacterium]|nr:GGDEF domain-containing protein [Paracoccaceae bacterium]
MDKFSLLTVTALILGVFGIAFMTASHQIRHGNYWRSWTIANFITSGAEVCFVFEAHMPVVLIYFLPNALLIIAFTFYVHGSRQFCDKKTGKARTLLPLPIFLVVCTYSYLQSDYSIIYTVTNIILTIQAFDTALEYWRERKDGLTSRYGLLFAFSLMGASFFSRIFQGLSLDEEMSPGLIDDTMLTVHLLAALIVTTTAGAFALALAFEKQASDHREASIRDPLTGAYNRREFKKRLNDLLDLPNRPPFALVLFDLDHFKSINDQFGHSAGDEVLQACSDVMQWHLREADIFARVGGEEFYALLPDVDRTTAFEISEKIRKTISEMRIDCIPDHRQITLSAGLYHGTGENEDYEKVLKLADEALYVSKKAGRNQISVVNHAA